MTKRDLAQHVPDYYDPLYALLPFALGSSACEGKGRGRGKAFRDMPLDVVEDDKAIKVAADIPGVSKEHINISTEKDVLTLKVDTSKEDKQEKEENGVKWHHMERSRTFVQRSLRMPETADMDKISASYTDGTLRITVPKREAPQKNKRIAIE